MKNIFSIAALASIASAQWIPDVPVDHRSLDEIYEAAKQEQGTLVVSAGGDGTHAHILPYRPITRTTS